MKILTGKFGKIYLALTAVLTAGIACWLVLLWLRLDVYENSVPENAAAQVFNRYFKELAFDKLFALEKSAVSKLETVDSYTAYVTEKAGSGKRNFIKIPEDMELPADFSAAEKKYLVFADGVRFAEFGLEEKTGVFGKTWKLSGIRTIFDTADTYTVAVPVGCDVYVNGKPLGDDSKTGNGLSGVMAGTYDIYTISGLIARPVIDAKINKRSIDVTFDGETNEYSAIPVLMVDIIESFTLFVNGIQIDDSFLLRDNIETAETSRLKLHRKIYRIPFGLGGEPYVSIVSVAGKEKILENSGDHHFVQQIVSDPDLEGQFKDRAINAAKTYSMFMTMDTNIRELQKYFESGTRIFRMVYSSEVFYFTEHQKSYFENETASDFFAWDNDIFSCRVTFDNYILRTASDLFCFPLDVTLFFRRVGEQFMVFDMIINAE